MTITDPCSLSVLRFDLFSRLLDTLNPLSPLPVPPNLRFISTLLSLYTRDLGSRRSWTLTCTGSTCRPRPIAGSRATAARVGVTPSPQHSTRAGVPCSYPSTSPQRRGRVDNPLGTPISSPRRGLSATDVPRFGLYFQ